MNIKQQQQFFDVDEISQRTRVQKPYFAFKQLWQEEQSLVGSFTPEQPVDHESDTIAAGELGRHMAILGSCAAVALHNGPEGYYLATKAHFVRKPVNQLSVEGIFHASAQVLDIGDRYLKASVQAWSREREAVAELECEYAILSPDFFRQKFQHYANDDCTLASSSPYQNPVPIYNLTFQHEMLQALAGPLFPQQCAGHFVGYPCWPVAIISQTAFQAVGALVRNKYGSPTKISIKDTQLAAYKLVGADNVLRFDVNIKSENDAEGLSEIDVDVFQGDDLIARLQNRVAIISVEL